MKSLVRLIVALVVGVVLAVGFAQGDQPTVGLVMKSLSNEFFQAMEEGAVNHVEQRGDLELVALGVQNETDLQAQVALVENLITQGVDAIVIAPADSRALVPVLTSASEQGIRVVNIDVQLDENALAEAGVDIPFVGPDNVAAAKLVGAVMAENLGQGGSVVILEGVSGAENAVQRARGFTEAAEEGALEIVASDTANWETDAAFELVTNLMTANADVQGVMASNDSMALGAVRALDALGLSDQVKVVGFDNIPAIQPLVCEGKVLATLDQFGAQQAADGIDVAMELLAGEERSGWIKTPVELITAEDLECS